MAKADASRAHADTVEYYRLVLAAHQQDPHAAETARADEAVLAMVQTTPDVLEMNRAFMEGGLAFAVTRAVAVDGARYQAEIYEELEEEAPAAIWRRRAEALARAAADYADLYAVSAKMDAEEGPVKENEGRLKWLAQAITEQVMLVAASAPAAGDAGQTTLVAYLDEVARRLPGVRFPDVLKLPRVRKRFFHADDKLARLAEVFETVNRKRLGGRF